MKESRGSGDQASRVNPQQEIMSVCLAVVRGLLTPDQARAAILGRTTPAPLGESLRLDPAIAREVGELGRLPERDREHCLELFKELWDSTPREQLLEEDQTLGRMLIDQHVVPPGQVEECRAVQDRLYQAGCVPLPRLGELLVRKGYLVPARKDPSETLRREDPAGAAPGPAPRQPSGRIPKEAEVALADPAQRFGRYVRVSLLGSGGAGEVWKSWDTALERWVALKFLRFEDSEELDRLRREAQLAAGLSHPNIAAVFEIADANDRTFLVMQYIEGETLETWPRTQHRPLVALMRQVCQAIQYAHEHGVVHRDIKPGNIMVDGSGRAFIMDFGLARQINSERSMNAHVLGTPSYMPPEQATGGAVDARSDVYSIGATLYELFSGRPPFRGKNVLETLDRVVRSEPAPLDRISEDLRTIVTKCLMKEPSRRYASAQEVAQELGRWEQGEAIVAHPPSILYRVSKKIVKRRAVLAAGMAGVAVAAVVAGWVVPRWLRADRGEIEIGQELAAERSARALEAKALDRARVHLDQARVIQVRLERLLMPESGIPDSARSLIDQIRRETDLAIAEAPSYPEALLEKAWILNMEKKRAEALDWCQKALAIRPDFTLAYLTRARWHLEDLEASRRTAGADPLRPADPARVREILQDLERIQALSKDTLEISFADGAHALVAGEYEKAARILEEYSQGSVSDYHAWQWTGGAWRRVPGMAAKAVRAFGEAIKYRPGLAVLWRSRGEARRELAQSLRAEGGEGKAQGALAEALLDLRRAQSLDAKDVSTAIGLSRVMFARGEVDDALAALSRALELGVGLPAPYVERGWARLRILDADGALADAEEAIRLGTADPAAKIIRGRARGIEGDVGGARADLDEVLARDPRQPRALVGLGDVERQRGNPKASLVQYERALGLNPALAEAYQHRAAAERDLGQWDPAIQDETRGIELDPADPYGYLERGVTLTNRGSWAEAERDFRKGLSLGPRRAERFWLRLWLVRARQGDAEGGRLELETLLKGRTSTPAGALTWRIGDFLVGRLSEKEFLETLERTEFSRKSIAEGYFFAGERALVEGRPEAARERFERCLKSGAFVAPGYSTAGAELRRLDGTH